MKVYIVAEFDWDHHENICVFDSEEKAKQWLEDNCKKEKDIYRRYGYAYGIEEYELL